MERWQNDLVEEVRALWLEGLSASEISRRIRPRRTSTTRNSVISLVYRLGLTRQHKRARGVTTAQRLYNKKPAKTKAQSSKAKRPTGPQFRETPTDIKALSGPQAGDVARVSLAERRDDQCRWPVNDPLKAGFGYCGAEKLPGLPYCHDHCARAYRNWIEIAPRYVPAASKKQEVEA